MAAAGQHRINEIWYGGQESMTSVLLLPVSWLFGCVVWLRRRLFAWGLARSTRVDLPVVVVGNLTVGGTGKTPITIWLVEALAERGVKAGVVSRGYHGFAGASPLPVLPHSDPAEVGDEPVLIAERCRCPVVVHPNRVAAARVLEEQGVDLIISDDGLQHYALARDLELVIVDGERRFGNGRLLPAGPLREPVGRLAGVHCVLVNAAGDSSSDAPEDIRALAEVGVAETRFTLRARHARAVGGKGVRPLEAFAGQAVHAVAAIGNPGRFFRTLQDFGIRVIPHPMPDHADLKPADLDFSDGLPVLITEKDAVKCRHFELDNLWFVPVDAVIADQGWLDDIEALARRRGSRSQ